MTEPIIESISANIATTLAGVTVLVALVSEIFVASVQDAAETMGMSDAFVGHRWRELYAGALADRYRCLSFGDGMLLDRRAA